MSGTPQRMMALSFAQEFTTAGEGKGDYDQFLDHSYKASFAMKAMRDALSKAINLVDDKSREQRKLSSALGKIDDVYRNLVKIDDFMKLKCSKNKENYIELLQNGTIQGSITDVPGIDTFLPGHAAMIRSGNHNYAKEYVKRVVKAINHFDEILVDAHPVMRKEKLDPKTEAALEKVLGANALQRSKASQSRASTVKNNKVESVGFINRIRSTIGI